MTASVADAAAMRAAAEGMDAIVHLAANPVDAPFDVILEPNIVGTQRVFEAAVAAGVPRVVYASSHHAAGFWPRSHPMRVTDPVRPDSHYGVSKVFGEAVGRLHHDKHGLQVACLRIQSWTDRPADTPPPRLVAEPARRRRARAPLPRRARARLRGDLGRVGQHARLARAGGPVLARVGAASTTPRRSPTRSSPSRPGSRRSWTAARTWAAYSTPKYD